MERETLHPMHRNAMSTFLTPEDLTPEDYLPGSLAGSKSQPEITPEERQLRLNQYREMQRRALNSFYQTKD